MQTTFPRLTSWSSTPPGTCPRRTGTPARNTPKGIFPGAVYFDIDEIADTSSGLPHMMPSAEEFARHMGRLGIGDGMRVVVYDGAGLFSAPRVWWMLPQLGARDVAILDGGAPAWRKEGRPWTAEPPCAVRPPSRRASTMERWLTRRA